MDMEIAAGKYLPRLLPRLATPMEEGWYLSKFVWTRLCKMTATSAEVLLPSLSREDLILLHLVGRHDARKEQRTDG